MKLDVAEEDLKARRFVAEIQTLQSQLGKLRKGSDEHAQVDQQLFQKKNELEAFRKAAQHEFLRQESQLYKTIYLEAADVIRNQAREKGYQLVLRVNREEIGAGSEPNAVLQGLNRAVLFYDPQNDLTDAVLETLNANYNAEQE